jgi:hypothetical protein
MVCPICGDSLPGVACYDCGEKVRKYDLLAKHCRDLLAIFETTEVSEATEKVFHPVMISCCRAMMMEKITEALTGIKDLSS